MESIAIVGVAQVKNCSTLLACTFQGVNNRSPSVTITQLGLEMMPDELKLYGEIKYGIGFIIFNRGKFLNGGGLSIFCSINEDGGELSISLGSMH